MIWAIGLVLVVLYFVFEHQYNEMRRFISSKSYLFYLFFKLVKGVFVTAILVTLIPVFFIVDLLTDGFEHARHSAKMPITNNVWSNFDHETWEAIYRRSGIKYTDFVQWDSPKHWQ